LTIVLITNLYPTEINEKKSKALHSFVQEWGDTEEVFVLKPLYLPQEFMLLKKGLFNMNNIRGQYMPIIKLPKKNIFLYPNIDKYLKRNSINPDVIISHMPVNHFIAYRYALQKRLPLIVGVHMSDIRLLQDSHEKKRLKLIKIYKYATKIACRSNAIYNEFVSLLPDLKAKAFIAFSGVNQDRIIKEEAFERKLERFQHRKLIHFITVAQLIKLKNIDSIIQALALLPEEIEWKYTIVGGGKERKSLESLSLGLNLQKRIRFTGEVEHSRVFDYLRDADVFIMPSAPETFGLSYLEAMASGLIVIGAKKWGVDGIIQDKENGFLVEAKVISDLEKTLEYIIELKDKNKLRNTFYNSFKTVLDYTQKRAAQNYLIEIRKACF